jgi:hypothetical protein
VVTRQAWAELDELFLPDAHLRLDLRTGSIIEQIGPAAIGAFIAGSIERFEFFAFTVQNTVVAVDSGGTSATGRVLIQELRQERAGHRWTTAFGLYRDTYRKVDGRWRFASRDYSSLARSSADRPGMDVFPIPPR